MSFDNSINNSFQPEDMQDIYEAEASLEEYLVCNSRYEELLAKIEKVHKRLRIVEKAIGVTFSDE